MPIYDYHCDHCGHTFSAVQSYTDATLEVCPSCGKKPRKLMATPAIVFKGGGWYKTDSRVTPKDGGADKAASGDGDGATKTDPDKADKADKKKEPAPTPAAASDGAKANGKKGDSPSTGRSETPDRPAAAAPKGDAASS